MSLHSVFDCLDIQCVTKSDQDAWVQLDAGDTYAVSVSAILFHGLTQPGGRGLSTISGGNKVTDSREDSDSKQDSDYPAVACVVEGSPDGQQWTTMLSWRRDNAGTSSQIMFVDD